MLSVACKFRRGRAAAVEDKAKREGRIEEAQRSSAKVTDRKKVSPVPIQIKLGEKNVE